MTTRSTRAPSSMIALTKRSWVSGRSAATPWSRIAIALASQAPIQIGRYRSCSVSLRITTWRFESMWTLTLSTTISTSRPISGLPHRSAGPTRGARHAQYQPYDNAQRESADVGKERDPTLGGLGPERGHTADQLEDEPEPQDDE